MLKIETTSHHLHSFSFQKKIYIRITNFKVCKSQLTSIMTNTMATRIIIIESGRGEGS